MDEDGSRARRDPEGRRRTIVAAAAALLVDGGPALSHRSVAERAGVPLGSTTYYFASLDALRQEALTQLGDRAEADLRQVAEAMAAATPAPSAATLGALLHTYVRNRDRVRSDMALYAAAARQDELRGLALRWFEGLVEVLAEYTDRRTATTLAIFADGTAVHTVLHDAPLTEEFLTAAAAGILAGTEGGRR